MAINAFGRAAVGAARRGTLEDGSLEVSNANISEEFSNLIVAQRPLEASTPGGTTFDGVPEDTPHMICKTSAHGAFVMEIVRLRERPPLRGEKPGNKVCRDC
jgi:hypothetical protein